MIPCQMDHFLGMILDHHQICNMMRGPRVFFPGGLGWGQGTRDSFVCAEGREGVPIFGLLVISLNFLVETRYPYPPLDPRIIV